MYVCTKLMIYNCETAAVLICHLNFSYDGLTKSAFWFKREAHGLGEEAFFKSDKSVALLL